MDKNDKPVWSTDDIRSHRDDWSLAADAALFDHIQSISQNVLQRTQAVLQAVDSLGSNLNVTATSISNTNDKFLFLANTQFVENRVYDDEDVTPSNPSTTQAQPITDEPELSSILEKAFSRGIDLVDSKYTEYRLPGSDSEDEELSSPSRLVPRPQNQYSSRLLPHLIGSAEFFKDEKVGLGSPSCSSDSSSSSSLSDEEEEEENSSPELKPYISHASLSSGCAESLESMDESKSSSPVNDDLFGSYRESLNSSGKLQAHESNLSDRLNHSETGKQYYKQADETNRKEPPTSQVKTQNNESFSHHIDTASSLFAPPPFNAEESSEESDNESLFAGRKHNRNHLFIDDDEDDDDIQKVQVRKQGTEKIGGGDGFSRNESDDKGKQEPPVLEDQTPPRKLPAGAVSIFGKNVNPFSSGPPLFPKYDDSDEESDSTPGGASDNGFSASHRSSSDFGNPKPDPVSSKDPAPVKKSLFDDDDDEEEKSADFDSLLFKSGLFPTKNASESSKKPMNSLFADSTEDIFSSSKDAIHASNKSSIFPSEGKASSKETGASKGKPDASKEQQDPQKKEEKENSQGPPLRITKPVSSSLFDSDDDLFSSPKHQTVPTSQPVPKSQVPPKTESLFDDSDTVDFTNASSKAPVPSKKPFPDLFDDNEDFLFSSSGSKEASSPKPGEKAAKSPAVDSAAANSDELFSKSSKVSGLDNFSKNSSCPNIFDDEDESDLFAESAVRKIETEASKQPPKVTLSNVSENGASKEDELFSKRDRVSISPTPPNISSQSIFNDEDESSLFAESVTTKGRSSSNNSSNVAEIESATPEVVSSRNESNNSAAPVTAVSAVVRTPPKSMDAAVKDDFPGHGAGDADAKTKPVAPPKPSSGAQSEIDKLKKKLTSSGSEDFSSDDGSAIVRPKAFNPGKLAMNRGQNINVAALMPGYKRSKVKSESATGPTDSLSSSESAPALAESSSQAPPDSVEVIKPVSKSTSLPISLKNNDFLSPVEPPLAGLTEESAAFSHFLANDTMKKRARVNSKRRPPSQKARQEAARTSGTEESFAHLDAGNDSQSSTEPTLPSDHQKNAKTENNLPNVTVSAASSKTVGEKISSVTEPLPSKFVGNNQALNKIPPILDDKSDEDELFSNTSTKRTEVQKKNIVADVDEPAMFGNKNASPKSASSIFNTGPPPFEPDDLFGENTPEKSVKDLPPVSAVSENRVVSNSVPPLFESSPPPLESDTDDLFQSAAPKPKSRPENIVRESLKSEKSSSEISAPNNDSRRLSKSKSSIFDDSPPPFDSGTEDLFNPLSVEKFKSRQESPVVDSSKSEKPSASIPVSNNEPKGNAKLSSTIFSESPPLFESVTEDLFNSSSAEKLKSRQESPVPDSSKSEKPSASIPVTNNEPKVNAKSSSTIFSESPPLFESVTEDLFNSSSAEKLKSRQESPVVDSSKSEKPSAPIPVTNNEPKVNAKSSSAIFSESPPLFESVTEDLFNSSSAEKLKSRQKSLVPDSKTSERDKEQSNSVSAIFSDIPLPTEPDDLFTKKTLPNVMASDTDTAKLTRSPSSEGVSSSQSNKAPTSDLIESEQSSSVFENLTQKPTEQNITDPASFNKLTETVDSEPKNLLNNGSESVGKAGSPKNGSTDVPSANYGSNEVSDSSFPVSHDSDLFSDQSTKVPNSLSSKKSTDIEDNLSQPSSKVPESVASTATPESKLNSEIEELSGTKKRKVTSAPKAGNETENVKFAAQKKSSLSENPLVRDSSDEDLFGSYSTKPVVSVLNKFKPGSTKPEVSEAPKKLFSGDPKSESKKEDDIFEADNIEKLFPKVKLGVKKASGIDPLSELSGDSEEEDLFDTSFLSPVEEGKQKLNESSKSEGPSFKPAESIENSSTLEDSFRTASSIHSDLDKFGDQVFPEEKHASKLEKSVASTLDKPSRPGENTAAISDPLFDTKNDLFKEDSPPKKDTPPTNLAPKNSKLVTSLFGDEEEDDDLFGSTKSVARKPKTPSSNFSVKTNPSVKSSLPSGSSASKKSSRESKSQKLFDDDEDEDLFGSTMAKQSKVKAVEPPKKEKSSRPKLNTSSIFGDEEDSDTELFAASLKKK